MPNWTIDLLAYVLYRVHFVLVHSKDNLWVGHSDGSLEKGGYNDVQEGP